MSLYDAVKDLPLAIESYDLRVDELDVSSGFTRKSTTITIAGAGQEGLGEDVTYEAAEHDAQLERGPVLPLAGTWTLASFSQRSRKWRCSSRSRTPRLRRLPSLGLRERRPRSGIASKWPVARRSRRTRVAPPDVRRLDAARRAAVARSAPRLARALPATPLQARRDERLERRARRGVTPPRLRRLDRLQGPLLGHGRRPGSRSRALPAYRRRPSRSSGSRTRRSRTAPGRSSSPSPSRSPGTRSSTRSRTSRRSRGRREP